MLKIFVTTVKDFLDGAEEFYRVCKRETHLDLENTIVVAQNDDDVVGIIRLCHENKFYVLRTMQIHPNYQRKGLGAQILKKYDQLLRERQIDEVYCMPYAHLESFYNKIGFVKICDSDAPIFLQERVKATRIRKPNEPVILMKRSH